jgi:hypothetical protein
MEYDENFIVRHFRKDVDLQDREDVIAFLTEHPRYNVMNSWNKATSYAHCIKINRLPLSSEQRDKAYELLDVETLWEDFLSPVLEDWERAYKHEWQIGTNGRSGGYLVLYRGGVRDDGKPFAWPGKSTDQDEDFHDWELEDLQARAELVRHFDLTCDVVLTEFVNVIEHYDVKEETVHIPRTVKMLVEKEE